MPMQVIHYTDDKIGSLDWELPPGIVEKLATLNEKDRQIRMETLQNLARSYLQLMMAVTSTGDQALAGLEMMAIHQAETIRYFSGYIRIMNSTK